MQNATTPQRLRSLDALRGSDMFFIMGGEGLIIALAALFPDSAFMQTMGKHMLHVDWHGFHFMDLVFPLFLFISGVTFPLSLASQRQKGMTDYQITLRIVRRGLMLVLFGLLYNGILSCTDLVNFRYASVLARIGLAWMLASLLQVWVGKKVCRWLISVLLLGYWALLVAFPVEGMDPYSMEGSLVGRIDRVLLPGQLYLKIHDPEGWFGLIPSTATALLGIEAGRLLAESRLSGSRKSLILIVAGITAIGIAMLWDIVMPINKNLWTSSFVMITAGWSSILLGVFYQIIDVWGFRRWAFVPAVIGMNSITIYLAQEFIDFYHTSRAIFTLPISFLPESLHPVMGWVAYIVTCWTFLCILYLKRIFLKV